MDLKAACRGFKTRLDLKTRDKNGHEHQARADRDSNAFILPGSTSSCASWSHYGHTTGGIRARSPWGLFIFSLERQGKKQSAAH